MSDKSPAYAAAEGRDFLAGELGNKQPEFVRKFAGLVDDKETLDLLNYYCELWRDKGENFLDTRMAQVIVSNASTGTIDEAFRAGNVSQLKGMVGLTSQTRDGEDLMSDAAKQLSHEGSIGLVLGPPGAGKTALTLDIARIWQARTGGTVVTNTSWGGADAVVKSDRELLNHMGHTEGAVLSVIDETAQELSGFGSGNKAAEEFSDSLTFVRKKEEAHGPHAKKGSVLMVNHTRTKTAKCFRDLCTFAVEKPSRSDPGRARLLESEGGKDEFDKLYSAQGITDTSETYSEHEASSFEILGSHGEDGDDADDGPEPDDIRRNEAIRMVISAIENNDMGYKDAAQLVDYSKEWVGNTYRDWRDENKHTELVSKDDT